MAEKRSAPSKNDFVCCNCKQPCGDTAKVQPWFVPDDGGDGKGKQEVWCAVCYAWIRVPRDDARWGIIGRAPWVIPVRCPEHKCGWVTVHQGAGPRCGMCHWPVVDPVQPKDPNQDGHITIVAPPVPGSTIGGHTV